MVVTPLYTALLALMLVALFLNVVRIRRKNKISLGDGNDPDLQRARSIHGNFIETVPFVLILMFFMEGMNTSIYVIHAFGIALILSRILHVLGIYHASTVGNGRVAAGIITMTLLIAGSVILLFKYIL